MVDLDLRLLGGFLLRADTRPRPLPVRKAQALLAYLALRAGRATGRETLMHLLWGDTRDRQARQSLRQTLVRVRRALSGSRRSAIVVQGDTITLNPSALRVDVAEFERLVRRGTADALEAATRLYPGPLLDGCRVDAPAFEGWLEAERTRLHELAITALRRLLARHERTGRVDAAIDAAGRLLGLDPLQEDIHRTLMRLYARQGRRAAALRQYQACVAIQQKELGVEPEDDTRRLYLEILQRRAPSPRRGAATVLASPRGTRSTAEAPLVGRAAELARLQQHLRAARYGRGRVVVVTGEPGIGKSRLAEELATTASNAGVHVLVGRTYESDHALPFRSWMDALRTGRVVSALLAGHAGSRPVRAELARLFPELSGGDAPPPITAESHVRLFEAIDALLAELARQGPLVLILEDLHWADEMTLWLLAFVARRVADRPLLLLGTLREDEETPAWRRTLGELTGLGHFDHVVLGALSEAATADLVRALARTDRRDAHLTETVRTVWTLSEGSPFVIVETVRAWRDGQLPAPADGALPQRVRDMITARLDRLSPRAHELARVAAGFTRDFEFAVLQRAAGFGRRETAEALEELVRRRILDAVGDRFDYTHERIRQAVYRGLLGPRRQAIHAAIGDALEAVYAGQLDQLYDRLAYHFARADDPARALQYTVLLADKVARSYALDDAVRALHDALAYTDRVPALARAPARLDVVYRLAHVLSLQGRPAEARDLLLEHEAMVLALRDSRLAGVHYFWLAYAYGNLGESEAAYRHAKRALEEAARSGDEITMGKASYELARELYVIGPQAEGIAHGRHAVSLLERTDERWWLGQALWTLALLLMHVGEFRPALELTEQLRVLGESIGERRLQAFAAAFAGRAYTVMGETEAALAATGRGVTLAIDPVARAITRGYDGIAWLQAGDAGRAIARLEEAVAELEAVGPSGGYRNRQIGSWFVTLLAESHLLRGDAERARELTAVARARGAEAGWPVGTGYLERAEARVMRALGKLDDAELAARQAIATFRSCGAVTQIGWTRLVLADVLARLGKIHAAAGELATARESFAALRAPRLVERTEQLAKTLGVPLG
jgi:DNA-binding SARP family transcriptional activator